MRAVSIYTLRDQGNGESMDAAVCNKHAGEMPDVDGESVTAYPAHDDDIECEFCANLARSHKNKYACNGWINYETGTHIP